MKLINRVLPTLLLDKGKLVKTIQFKNPTYIGDPINAVKIFNDKEVDEIILLDISVGKENNEPDYTRIEEICSEAFMPFAYGGGIRNIDQIKRLFQLGIEKVVLNSVLSKDIAIIEKAASIFGSQSIVASVDVKKDFFGRYSAYTHSGKNKIKEGLESFLKKIESYGAGELILNSINLDGTFSGYDLDIIRKVSDLIDIPVVACGGASELDDFKEAVSAGASAAAAGSFFVYRSKKRGILISYPEQSEIKELFS